MKTVSMCLSIPKFIADKVNEYSSALKKSRGRMVSEMLAKDFGINIVDGTAMDMIDMEEWKNASAGGSNAGTSSSRNNPS